MVELFHIISIALPISLAALGAGIGQGLIGIQAIQAINLQPRAISEIRKISVVGLSLTETSAILGLVISILMLLNSQAPTTDCYYASLGRIGIGLAIGLTGIAAGIASSFPAQAACLSTARQPFFSNKILQLMLITQTIIMTPNIFGFIIALLINTKITDISNLNEGLQMLSAGLVMGLGSIGPCIGLSLFAQAACTAIGANRKSYGKVLTFAFICQAIIETPIIFSFLISLLIFYVKVLPGASFIKGITFITSACCMGLSTIGTGISAGKTGSSACLQIGNKPNSSAKISQVGLLSLAMIDTFAIFGFIIATMLLYAI